MEKTSIIFRIVFGVMLLFFGINGFYPLMPTPNITQEMGMFMEGLMKAVYLFPLINLIKIVAGLLIILNIKVPLALLLPLPILLNALLAHLFLDPGTILLAAIAFSLNMFLILTNTEKYRCLI